MLNTHINPTHLHLHANMNTYYLHAPKPRTHLNVHVDGVAKDLHQHGEGDGHNAQYVHVDQRPLAQKVQGADNLFPPLCRRGVRVWFIIYAGYIRIYMCKEYRAYTDLYSEYMQTYVTYVYIYRKNHSRSAPQALPRGHGRNEESKHPSALH